MKQPQAMWFAAVSLYKKTTRYGRQFLMQGKVADYIPELSKANPMHPGLCIGTYGPSLDEKGNSIGGGRALEHLSREMHLHIFDSENV